MRKLMMLISVMCLSLFALGCNSKTRKSSVTGEKPATESEMKSSEETTTEEGTTTETEEETTPEEETEEE